MELPRYQAKNVPVNVQAGAQALRTEAQVITSLADRLQAFKGQAVQSIKKDAVKEASENFRSQGLEARTVDGNGYYADTYNERMQNLYNQRVKLDINSNLQQIYANNPDNPDAFQKEADSFFKGYSSKIDPNQLADVEISYASYKTDYEGKVKVNALDKLKKAEKATLDEYIVTISNDLGMQARGGNMVQAEYKAQEFIKNVDDGLRLGHYTPDQARRLKEDAEFSFISNVLYGKNDRHIEAGDYEASQKLIQDLKDKVTDQYSVEQKDQMIARMETDLTRAVKKEQAKTTSQKALIHNSFVDFQNSIKNGDIPKNAEQVLKSNLSDVDRVDAKEWVTLLPDLAKFKHLSPKVQSEMLAEYEAKGITTGIDKKRIDAMRAIKNRLDTMVNKSPIEAAYYQGATDKMAKIKDFSPQGMAVIKERIDNVRTAQNLYGRPTGALLEGEAKYLSDSFASMATDQKALIIKGIVDNLPTDVARSTLSQINKEKADSLLVAGSLLAEGQRGVATEIMNGVKAIQENLKGVTPREITIETTSALSEPLGHLVQSDPNTLKGYTEAIRAVYITRATEKGIDLVDIDSTLMDEVVDDVLGGTQEVNGKKTIAPKRGMSSGDFEDWFEELPDEAFDDMVIAGDDNRADTIEAIKDDATLISIGGGRYFVKWGGHYLRNREGTANFVLTYKEK